MMKRLFALVLSLSLLLPACAFAQDGSEPLRVGMECDYAPYNWTQAEDSEYAVPIAGGGGYADGYDVQMARRIADALGRDLEVVKTEWAGLPLALMNGGIDLIIAGMNPTAERRMTIDFTDAYYQLELVLVVRRDGPFANAQSLNDLSGARIVAQLNTFHDAVIDQIPGVIHAMPLETFPAMIVALQNGAVDGYVAERPGAEADTLANPDLTFISFEPGQGFAVGDGEDQIAIGVRKGNDELREQVNEVLATISQEERDQLMEEAKLRQPLVSE